MLHPFSGDFRRWLLNPSDPIALGAVLLALLTAVLMQTLQ
jgi:hypothetical protein